MKNRKHVNRESIINTLELPKDLFLGVPVFTLTGDGELVIENHRGIQLYSQEQIIVRSRHFMIRVDGQNLFIESYSADGMMIHGKIENIGITQL